MRPRGSVAAGAVTGSPAEAPSSNLPHGKDTPHSPTGVSVEARPRKNAASLGKTGSAASCGGKRPLQGIQRPGSPQQLPDQLARPSRRQGAGSRRGSRGEPLRRRRARLSTPSGESGPHEDRREVHGGGCRPGVAAGGGRPDERARRIGVVDRGHGIEELRGLQRLLEERLVRLPSCSPEGLRGEHVDDEVPRRLGGSPGRRGASDTRPPGSSSRVQPDGSEKTSPEGSSLGAASCSPIETIARRRILMRAPGSAMPTAGARAKTPAAASSSVEPRRSTGR